MTEKSREEFTRRLDRALDHAGVASGRGRVAYIAQLAGVTHEAARKWLRAMGMPTTTRAVAIAEALGCSAEWLLSGRGAAPKWEGNLSVDTPPPTLGKVPIVGWDSLMESGPPRTLREIPAVQNKNGSLFGLRLRDDSMEAASPPSFPPGAYIVVDPDPRPGHADFVLATIGGTPAFRQLLIDGRSRLLRPLNER